MYKCGYISGSVWISPGATSIMPCCYTAGKAIDANGIAATADSLLNHPGLVEVRQTALRGEVPTICKSCEYYESNDIVSPRLKSNQHFANKGEIKTTIAPADLEHMFISLSNVCNFKCVICSPSQSHLIAKEQGDPVPLKSVDEQFVDQLVDILSHAPNLKALQISGGEPFYNKPRLEKILDACPKSTHVYLHTNGSIYDERLMKKLELFRSAAVSFSIDGVEGSFEYQRVNGSWDQVIGNVAKFKDTINVSTDVNYTVSCFTLLSVIPFLKHYRHLFNRINLQELHYPEEFDLSLIRDDYLFHFITEFEYFLEQLNSDDLSRIKYSGLLKKVYRAIDKPPSKKLVDRLWNKVDYMKRVRGIDLQEKIPEAYNFLRK